jgi:hypothetical protein
MKHGARISWAVASIGFSCGGSSTVAATLYVEPVPEPDRSCVGVVGFQVAATSGAREVKSAPLLNPAPVLDAAKCGLSQSFTVEDLDLEAPVQVSVIGFDGAGAARVSGMTLIDKLATGSRHIQLQGLKSTVPVLVIERARWLQGASLSTLTALTISTAKMQPTPILSVDRSTAGAYFDTEPAAYGVPLDADGGDDGLAVTMDLIGSTNPKGIRLSLGWNAGGLYYEAK